MTKEFKFHQRKLYYCDQLHSTTYNGVLISQVKKNLDVLKDMKVIKLTISYHIIWDICTRDMI